MPAQYAPLPNPRIDPDAEDEMNAAFADSDNESDGDDANEAQPLRRPRRRSQASSRRGSSSIDRGGDDHDDDDGPLAGPSTSRLPMPAAATSAIPAASSSGGYDFDNVDYAAHAPPGSPPPATLAFANDWGNSNGILPGPSSGPSSSSSSSSSRGPTHQRRAGWLGRAVGGVLPEGVARRLGIGAGSQRPRGAVGGGTQNDGVFANVMAKPVRPVRVQDGDGTYVVPEDAQREQPPSYAAAQADPAPTYWEATTVHVPGGAAIAGEVIVDGLATGPLFSFLWNGLISVSFQFIGFLLTYLLHTTHAARLGSRAGLGITLIQYGFALRRSDYWNEDDAASGGGGTSSGYIYPPPTTSEGTPEAQADYYRTHNTSAPVPASDTLPEGSVNYLVSESTTEWLAFFLMTVGWFILLTSLLGYWRVKRWERSILASTPAESTNNASASSADTPQMPVFGFFNVPGFPGALRGGNHGGGGPFTPSILRQGLGFARSGGRRGRSGRRDGREEDLYFHTLDLELGPDEDEEARARAAQAEPRPGHTQFVINESDPERAQQLARALVAETRLNVDLRAAGLI